MLFLITLFIILFLLVAFIPYGNDNGTVWRTPWVTFSIILLNVAIYMGTCTAMEKDYSRLEISANALTTYLKNHPQLIDNQRLDELYLAHIMSDSEVVYWKDQLARYHRGPADLDRYSDEYANYQALLKDYRTIWDNRFDLKWGYVPANPSFITMFSCMFLHGGLLHLFGNMIFLFSLGFSLEDLWGRWLFAGFYLVSGLVATVAYHLVFSSSNIPLIGASGAIAGVMGAYLIRLFKTRIKFLGAWILYFLHICRMILVPAYIFLPIWFLWEYHDATSTGNGSGVAHWAHVGGFAFGMIVALGLKVSKIEEKFLKPSIEAKIDYGSSSKAITEALSCMETGDIGRAEKLLDAYIIKNPDDVDAGLAIVQVNELKNDVEGTRKAYGRLIHQYLKNDENDLAVSTYDSLLSSYAEDNPPMPLDIRDWMMICEYLDNCGMHQIAAVEYRRAGRSLKNNGFAIKALLISGEIFLEKVRDNREAAITFLEAKALNPTQPHWIERLNAGIEKIKQLEMAKAGRTAETAPQQQTPVLNTQPAHLSQSDAHLRIPPGGLSL